MDAQVPRAQGALERPFTLYLIARSALLYAHVREGHFRYFLLPIKNALHISVQGVGIKAWRPYGPALGRASIVNTGRGQTIGLIFFRIDPTITC